MLQSKSSIKKKKKKKETQFTCIAEFFWIHIFHQGMCHDTSNYYNHGFNPELLLMNLQIPLSYFL